MDFFDKLGKKATQTYNMATEKTTKVAKEAKLKMKLNEAKNEIEEMYRQIGIKVYQKHINDEEIKIEEELVGKLNEIDIKAREVEDINNEILELKDKKRCSNCHSQINYDYRYCPECGKKQDEIVKEVEILEENKQEE